MCKNSCLSCKHYKHKETKVVGRKLVCDGMMSIPVYKDFPHHCETNQEYFEKLWEKNKNKTHNDDDYVEPICYEPTELNKDMEYMIGLMKDILNNIPKKDEQEKISQ